MDARRFRLHIAGVGLSHMAGILEPVKSAESEMLSSAASEVRSSEKSGDVITTNYEPLTSLAIPRRRDERVQI